MNDDSLNHNLLDRLHACKNDINEKIFGNISSFNFKRSVFFDGKWNDLTIKARGLFINNKTGKIVARGFEKFFAYNEQGFNTDDWLKKNLKFPLQCYEKHNGFLGILGFKESELLFCTKSMIGGDYGKWFMNIFKKDNHKESELLDFMKQNNVGLVFEVIDHINDPHIVEYDSDKIILLDVIKLEEKFAPALSFDELVEFGSKFNFIVKDKISIQLNCWDDLKKFIEQNENDKELQHEGYVFVDSNNYYFKYKCPWYRFWKNMRSLKNRICSKHNFSISKIKDSIENKFLNWMMEKGFEWIKNRTIIELRNEFRKENK